MIDLLKKYKNKFQLSGGRTIAVDENGFSVFSENWQLFDLIPSCSAPINGAEDLDKSLIFDGIEKCESATVCKWHSESTCWNKKEYILKIYEDYATFQVVLHGTGAPDKILFFKGLDGRFSQYETAGYTLPQFQDVDHERAKQLCNVEGVLMPLRCAPPPFVFPFWSEYNSDWCGVGIAAEKGNNNYERFIFKPVRRAGFYFELPLHGYTEISVQWDSPLIWFGFGKDDMEIFNRYSQWTYDALNYPRYHGSENVPEWWKMPIFCGWGEQCILSVQRGCKDGDIANQKDYEAMMERLDRLGLAPGAVFIDAGWAKDNALTVDTEKWHDLRAFADSQHAKGRRVILWQHVWDCAGYAESVRTSSQDYKPTVDPTNPEFLKELRKNIYKVLSSDDGCFNCDGFKMDFEDNLPREEAGVVMHKKGVYGIELMRLLFEAYYKYSKEVKADALINTSAIHPYFADICDQIRLHDYWSTTRSTVGMMAFRSALTRAVMPDVLIDTDHEHIENNQQALMKSLADSRFGIPCLYNLSNYSDEELLEIKENWEKYKKTIKKI